MVNTNEVWMNLFQFFVINKIGICQFSVIALKISAMCMGFKGDLL